MPQNRITAMTLTHTTSTVIALELHMILLQMSYDEQTQYYYIRKKLFFSHKEEPTK